MKKRWRALKNDEPGSRFQNRFKRAAQEGSAGRFVKIALGGLLLAAGVVFLIIPGPGSILMLVGVAILAETSQAIARGLDSVELWLRSWAARAR